MTRALTRLRGGLLLGAAAAMAMALSAAPQASAQLPQLHLPGLTIGLVQPAAPGTAPAIDPASGQYRAQLEDATNAARAAHGLAPLAVNDGLTGVATGWSGVQAAQNRMSHNPIVGAQLPAGWAQYGENVLQNYAHATPQQLVDQWMASPGHRANILNPGLNTMGVGAAVAGDGKLYATQVFAQY